MMILALLSGLVGAATPRMEPMVRPDRPAPSAEVVLESMLTGRARLSLMRADGVELAWVEGDVRLPGSGPAWLLPDAIEFGPSGAGFDLVPPGSELDLHAVPGNAESLRFVVDRSTALHDGGISGSRGAIGNEGVTRLSSITAGEGEYDFYDLALAWDALSDGPVTVSLTGGLKAIDARIGRVIDDGGTSTYHDARGVVAVPVIGGGVSWQLDDNIAFSGSAVTQSFGGQGSVLDMSAETNIRLAPNIGFSAGYQFIRSAIRVQSIGSQLEREGVYARIRIEF